MIRSLMPSTLVRLLMPVLFIVSLLMVSPQHLYAAYPLKTTHAVVQQHAIESTSVNYKFPAAPMASGTEDTKGRLNIASLGLGLFGDIALLVGFTAANLGLLAVAGGIAALLAVIFGKIGRGGKHSMLGTIGTVLGIAGIGALIIIGIFSLIL